MTIYCTYDHATSALYSNYRYVIAQNNNLADVLNIKIVGLTDLNRHTYRIDFLCRTHGGAVKAKYSSPVIAYETDGLNFEIPNCLTQYEGYVEAQLIIREADNPDVTIKSVGREGGVFEVAPSANVLETRIVEPGNILTELSTALLSVENMNDEVVKTAQEAKTEIQNALAGLADDMDAAIVDRLPALVGEIPFIKVEFWFYDELVASCLAIPGKVLPYPDFTPPSKTVLTGWFCIEKDRHWDFSADVAGEQDIRLFADVCNSSYVSYSETESELVVGNVDIDKVYLPFTYDGHRITKVRFEPECAGKKNVYVNDSDYQFVNAAAKNYVVSHGNSRYKGGRSLIRKDTNALAGLHMDTYGVLEVDLSEAESVECTFSKFMNNTHTVIKGSVKNPLPQISDKNYILLVLIIEGNTEYNLDFGEFYNLQAVIYLSPMPVYVNKIKFTSRYAGCKTYVPDDLLERYKEIWSDTEIYPLSSFPGENTDEIIVPSPEELV